METRRRLAAAEDNFLLASRGIEVCEVGCRHALPDPIASPERAQARWHPERETLELATAGAAQVLGADHSATRALAKASITMSPADLWNARRAVKTLRLEQRRAIAAATEV